MGLRLDRSCCLRSSSRRVILLMSPGQPLARVFKVVLSVTISKGVRLAMVPRSHRALGSIGAGTTPGRVYKGKKMPGRMGGTKTKIRKLKIVKIDNDLRVVMIKGALPGKPGNLLRIAPAKIVGKNIPKS
ncbi:hypothetical protein NC652_031241 [Populus alba x Populus x berolinensis]|nr:hypothetical protein NC652_031241 [Populus alba x Populus x berolinensis]